MIPDYLRELLPAESDVFLEIIELFLHDAAAELSNLKQHTELNNMTAVAMTLHTLKGSSKQVGGLQMGDTVEAMEVSLQSGDRDSVRKGLPELEIAFDELQSQMKVCLEKLADTRHGG